MTGQLATAVATQQAAQAARRRRPWPQPHRSTTSPAPSRTAGGSSSSSPGPRRSAGAGGGPRPGAQPVPPVRRPGRVGWQLRCRLPDGLYMGAFQFSQSTWNCAAQAAGRPDLIGVPPTWPPRPTRTPWRSPSMPSTDSSRGWVTAAAHSGGRRRSPHSRRPGHLRRQRPRPGTPRTRAPRRPRGPGSVRPVARRWRRAGDGARAARSTRWATPGWRAAASAASAGMS